MIAERSASTTSRSSRCAASNSTFDEHRSGDAASLVSITAQLVVDELYDAAGIAR
jgi:hypothetical protein